MHRPVYNMMYLEFHHKEKIVSWLKAISQKKTFTPPYVKHIHSLNTASATALT